MSKSGFPSDFLPLAEKKDVKFHLAYQKAIGNDSVALFSIPFEQRRKKFIELRRTAQGYSSLQQFKSRNGKEDLSALNLNYDVPDPIPVMVSKIVGQQMAQEMEVRLTPNDPMSISEMNKKRERLKRIMILSQNRQAIIDQFGIDPLEGVNEKEIYTSEDEIDLQVNLNEKPSIAIAFEQAVDTVLAKDKQELEFKLRRDLVTLNIAGIKCKMDDMGNICDEYVDPVNWGTSYCKKNDFSDAKYHFERREITLEELQAEAKLSNDQLRAVAKQCMGNRFRPEWNNGIAYYGYEAPYRDFLVVVQDAEYRSLDKMLFRKKPNRKNGGFFLEPVKNKNKEGEYIEKDFGSIYCSTWIVNTEIVYNHTKKENNIIEYNGTTFCDYAEFSYRMYCPEMYDMRSKSLVEKMIEPADKIRLVALKMAHLIGKMKPPVVAVDIAALNNALSGMGEKSYQIDDFLNIYEENGVYYYSSKGEGGAPMYNTTPIREIPTNYNSAIQDLIAVHTLNMRILEEVTGVPAANLSMSSKKEELVGLQKMANANQINAIRFLNHSYEYIMKKVAGDICRYVAMAIKEGIAPERYGIMIGSSAVEIIKMTERIPLSQLGVTIQVSSDIDELAYFDKLVELEMSRGLLDAGIVASARALAKTNVQYAAQYLATMARKFRKEQAEQEQARIQQTAQANAEAAVMAEEAKKASYTHKIDEDIRKLKAEYLLKIDLENVIHTGDMDEIELKGDKEIEKVEVASEIAQQAGAVEKGEKIEGSIPAALGVRQPRM